MVAKDPYRFFRVEARELLDQLSSGLLGLEAGADPAGLARLLRQAHTLKGAARIVRQTEIAERAHGIEEALAAGPGQVPARPQVARALAELDAIAAALARLPAPEGQAPTGAAAQASEAGPRLLRTDHAELARLLSGLGEVGRELGALQALSGRLAQCRALARGLERELAPRRGAPAARALRLGAQSARLVELLEEAERAYAECGERGARELQQARETAERLRLIPVSSLFAALERTCRDAALSLGRQTEFAAQGGELLLDAEVLEPLQGALVQLVRNAVAHGIETPEQRRAAGKPERGRVWLEVRRRGQRVALRCCDDGRGIDYAALRGRLPGAAGLAPTELLRLLFQGGLSTAKAVDQIAGRGIGMDLVRATVERLGGSWLADSQAGQGTWVELQVPVSLAMFDALLFDLEGQRAALPLEAVRATLRVQGEQLLQGEAGPLINLDGRLIPLRVAPLGGGGGLRRNAVLIESEGEAAALLVDRLEGGQSIVLQALPALCPVDPVVLGCWLDAAGDPVPVLDPAVLVRGQVARSVLAPKPAESPAPVLVVDDSLTTRMLEQSILEGAGLPVETSASAEEALEMARRQTYSLFLVDVEMPGMDGFDFVARTRADPRLQRVPCIMVTSCDSPEHRARGQAVGASAYLIKSQFNQAEFLRHVDRLRVRETLEPGP